MFLIAIECQKPSGSAAEKFLVVVRRKCFIPQLIRMNWFRKASFDTNQQK
jgi:hypothetical protein